MDFSFKKELSPEELAEAERFYLTIHNVAIEQHPAWHQVIRDGASIRFFISRRDSQMNCFAVIHETNYIITRTARISFGPIFADPEVVISSIQAIRSFYKADGCSYLAIQLPVPLGNVSEYIEYQINKTFNVKYVLDRNNWSSLVINLTDSVEEITRHFSKGHKSAIKKSLSLGVCCRTLYSTEEIDKLSSISGRMQYARGLVASLDQDPGLFRRIHAFVNEKKLGFFLAVFDQNNVMVGGIIVIYQGETARYYKGAADPDRKDISILHVAIAEAIKITKASGCKLFDLWGYNHMVEEGEQIFYVNRFKKGFTTNFLFYPKTMHISLKPWGYALHKNLTANRKKIKFIASLLKNKKRI